MDHAIIFLEITLINLLLSGDNAIVIAMASQGLPKQQRKQALLLGTGAAIALRCMLAAAAIQMLKVPYLQAAGAIFLIVIAVKLLADSGHEVNVKGGGKTLRQAVATIVMADVVMSLDNVIAIAAIAGGDIILIFLGIILSIPIILWGSSLFTTLLHKFPALAYIGAGMLAYTAGDMLIKDKAVVQIAFFAEKTLQEFIPLFCVPLVFVIAIMRKKLI